MEKPMPKFVLEYGMSKKGNKTVTVVQTPCDKFPYNYRNGFSALMKYKNVIRIRTMYDAQFFEDYLEKTVEEVFEIAYRLQDWRLIPFKPVTETIHITTPIPEWVYMDDEDDARLTIVRGLPGSGKSTYAKSLNVLHLDNDFFSMINGEYKWSKSNKDRGIVEIKQIVDMMLTCNRDVVVSNVFEKISDFEPLIEIARQCLRNVSVVRMTGNYGNIHDVPESEIERMRNEFEDYKGEILI